MRDNKFTKYHNDNKNQKMNKIKYSYSYPSKQRYQQKRDKTNRSVLKSWPVEDGSLQQTIKNT